MSLSTAELERFVARLADQPDRWQHLVRHDPGGRVYELIHDDEHVNAWLICWSEDQDTGFHDHDTSAAAIAVIEGHVREDRLRLAATPESRVVGPGATLTMPPTAIHRVLHAGGPPAVTIHAYSPPLTRTGAYWVAPTGELQRIAQSFEEELRAVA
jgi:mannose-6-phosphate isomerase-like protein (cupin superfamily)